MNEFVDDMQDSKAERSQNRDDQWGLKHKVASREKDPSKKEQRRDRRRAHTKSQPQNAPEPHRLQWGGDSNVQDRKAVISFYINSIRVLPLASKSRLAHAGGSPS